jgi:hypothetical protein
LIAEIAGSNHAEGRENEVLGEKHYTEAVVDE